MSVLLVILLSLLQAQPSPERSSIEGRLARRGSGDPVVRARLLLAKVGGRLEDYRTGSSDEGGRFAFRDLTPGTYRLYAEREGYPRTEHEVRLTLVAGQALKDVVLTMTPNGVITGRVLDSNRNPLRHVWVRALEASYFYGQRGLGMVNYSETDERGEYRIFGQPPGLYFVSATPQKQPRIEGDMYVVPAIPSNANGNQSEIRTAGETVLTAGSVDSRAYGSDVYLTAYYPGTADAGAATPVDLRPGATVSGIDMTVMSAPAVHVRGKIINGSTGQPAQSVAITLTPRGQPNGASTAGTRDSMGSFDLAAVPSGSYYLSAQTTNLQNALYGRLPVDVGNRDLENLALVLQPGITITGRVTLEGGEPISSAPGVARFFVQLNRPGGGGYSQPLQPDGSFSIPNVRSEDYSFRLFPPTAAPAAYVKTARLGSLDALKGVHVDDDIRERQLDIVVSLNSGNVSALVVDDKAGSQRPVQGATVAVVPDPSRRNRSELYRTVTTDASGRAQITGLPPGDYKLFASQDVEPASWQDPDLIRMFDGRGEAFTIVERGQVSLTLKLIPPRD